MTSDLVIVMNDVVFYADAATDSSCVVMQDRVPTSHYCHLLWRELAKHMRRFNLAGHVSSSLPQNLLTVVAIVAQGRVLRHRGKILFKFYGNLSIYIEQSLAICLKSGAAGVTIQSSCP